MESNSSFLPPPGRRVPGDDQVGRADQLPVRALLRRRNPERRPDGGVREARRAGRQVRVGTAVGPDQLGAMKAHLFCQSRRRRQNAPTTNNYDNNRFF